MKMIALLLMAVVSLPSMAQYKMMPRTNAARERGAMTLVQNALPAQYSVKIKKTVNSDIPEGYARVTLTTHDIWHGFDGTGYQMLLDQDGDTYGRIIPETGNFTEYGNAPAGAYDEFEYKIPEEADGDIFTDRVLIDGSISILIPAGVYDWCITNPTPSTNFSKIYMASDYGNIGGRAEHYLFSGGLEYEFDITLGENGCDQTNLTIKGLDLSYDVDNITYNSADVNWAVDGPFSLYSVNLRYRKVNETYYFDSESAEGFDDMKWDADEDGHNWQYEQTGDAHSGKGVWASYSFNEDIYVPMNPDNWLLMPKMDLKGKHLSFFARSKNKEYHDNFGVFFLPDGKERDPENLEQLGVYTDIPHEWTEYNIDLSTLGEGQVVFRHFDSGDRWALYIDDVTIFDQNAVYHPEEYNWVNMPYVNDHPHLIFNLESDTKYEMQMQVEPAGWGESVFFTTSKCLVLEDHADNSTVLADNQGYSGYVKLNGRTLYKDGTWNSLCLPFDLKLSGSILDSEYVELKTLGSALLEEGVLYLDFVNADEIKAGQPYIIRWTDGSDSPIENPVFKGVTISSAAPDAVTSEDGAVRFAGNYSPVVIAKSGDKTKLYIGTDNKLHYPEISFDINAFHAYFQLGKNLIVSNMGDVNGDWKINVADITEVVAYILGRPSSSFILGNADVTGDGEITVEDVTALVNIILNGNQTINVFNVVVSGADDLGFDVGEAGGSGPARVKGKK